MSTGRTQPRARLKIIVWRMPEGGQQAHGTGHAVWRVSGRRWKSDKGRTRQHWALTSQDLPYLMRLNLLSERHGRRASKTRFPERGSAKSELTSGPPTVPRSRCTDPATLSGPHQDREQDCLAVAHRVALVGL